MRVCGQTPPFAHIDSNVVLVRNMTATKIMQADCCLFGKFCMSEDQQLITIYLWIDRHIHNLTGILISLKAERIRTNDHTTSLCIHTISRAVEIELIETRQMLEQIENSMNGEHSPHPTPRL